MAVYHLEVPSGRAGRELTSQTSRIAAGFARIRDSLRVRRSIRQLLKLDDRLLNDIGLTRGDVVAALSGSIVDDAGRRLNRFVRERRSGKRAASMRSSRPRQMEQRDFF